MKLDIFCRVIDNLGDIGVSWRLAKQLQTEYHAQIRLWVDDLVTFARLEPSVNPLYSQQNLQKIDIYRWDPPTAPASGDLTHPLSDDGPQPHPMVISSFCCDLDLAWQERMRAQQNRCWIELEYFSAEPWVQTHHMMTSKRSDGLEPTFFYPGLTPQTAGLIRERDVIARRNQWQADPHHRQTLFDQLGLTHRCLNGLSNGESIEDLFLVSLFTYPHAPLAALWRALQQRCDRQTVILVPEGVNMPDDLPQSTHVSWQRIPFLSQADYDTLLWSMDLNIVRGEDSFVRALWAGKPLLWHIYPQEQAVHIDKLNAWLAHAQWPDPIYQASVNWVTGDDLTPLAQGLDSDHWPIWQEKAIQYTQHIARLPDLASQIADFYRKKTQNPDSG